MTNLLEKGVISFMLEHEEWYALVSNKSVEVG